MATPETANTQADALPGSTAVAPSQPRTATPAEQPATAVVADSVVDHTPLPATQTSAPVAQAAVDAPPAAVPAPESTPDAAVSSVPAGPASSPALPAVASYALPIDHLQQIAQSSGLVWVNSDPTKVAAVQAAIAAEPQPVRVPRERPAPVVIQEGPLVLVETRKDLNQLQVPF